MVFRADSAGGADHGFNGEVIRAREHGGDAGRTGVHASSQFSTGNPMLFHDPQEFFHKKQLLIFRLTLDREGRGKELSNRACAFRDFNFHQDEDARPSCKAFALISR